MAGLPPLTGTSDLIELGWAAVIGFFVTPDLTLFVLAARWPEWLLPWTVLAYLGSLLNGWTIYAVVRWGRHFLDRLGWLKNRIHRLEETKAYQQFKDWMHRFGARAIMIGSVVHVSYLSMMLCAGISKMPISQVVWGCIVGRALRFLSLALLILVVGTVAQQYLPFLPFLAVAMMASVWLWKRLKASAS